MSHSLEDSPISDGKMDISETTTSIESPCISPDIIESEQNKINESDIKNLINLTNNIGIMATTSNTSIKTKEIQSLYLDNHDNNINNIDNSIDDDKDCDSSVLINNSKNITPSSSFRSTSTLTLVNKHPLMSPPPTSFEGNRPANNIQQNDNNIQSNSVFNYPDIVPKNTHINDKLDIVTHVINRNTQRKIFVSDPNFDYLSDSDSEPELSQYQATVEPSFQTVALISINNPSNSGSGSLCYKTNSSRNNLSYRRKMEESTKFCDNISSADSISNNSIDDDLEENLASLSPTSSIMDDYTFNDDFTPTKEKSVEPLPQYTADEERRDSRNWQKITLPDGKTREIDMKVIDPYKRVLSHGGYLKVGGHNAIVVFSACHLPDRSRTDYHYVMDNLFLYVVKTLEQLVTEDYVLIYLHGGSNRSKVPPFPWLKRCYQLIDRRLRKSLKNLFLVHPTFWLKSIVWMSRPFVSSKFWRKMIYVRCLDELYKLVPVEKAAVPDKVKNYDSKFT